MNIEYHFAGWLGAAMVVAIVAIIFAKLVIARQFMGLRNGDPRVRRSLNLLIAIFVLSTLTAYIPRLFHLPELLVAAFHFALAGCAWAYALGRQAELINDAIKRAGNGHGD